MLAVSLVGASGCEDYDGAEGSVTYKPLFAPISVSINEKGELSVSFDKEITTPIGTFSLNITPPLHLGPDDGLLEILHDRNGEPVHTLFQLLGFGKSKTGMSVAGGSNVQESGDQRKTRIEIPADAGAQNFTIEAEDGDAVATPTTTSSTEWSEPAPTSTSPESSVTPSNEPSSTEPSDSVPASLPPVEVTPTN